MIWYLQITVSLLFFANKVFILAEKKTGWLVGALAAFLAIFYFYFIGLYVYTALEFGLVALMSYGFLKRQEKNPKVETAIRVVTVAVMIALAGFAFSGLITVVELGSSLGLLMGTYCLTHKKISLGWALYVVGHVLAAILGYHKGQQFFADLQIASAIVSVVGLMKKRGV